MFFSGLYGAAVSQKKEEQAMEIMGEAWDMKNQSRQILSEKKDRAIKSCQGLCTRKNATIQNLIGFKKDLQIIINLDLIMGDEELATVESINIEKIEKFENYKMPPISAQSNMAALLEMINPLTGGIAGLMIRGAERSLKRADYQWDLAKQEQSANKAEAEIYEQISILSEMQKTILSKLNKFFNHGRKYVRHVIEKNGNKKANYSSDERKKITLVVQCAKCMNSMLNVELMNEKHQITEQAEKLMKITEQFMEKSIIELQ